MDIFKLKEILESKKYTVNSSELKELIEKSVENYSSYDDKAKILNYIYLLHYQLSLHIKLIDYYCQM